MTLKDAIIYNNTVYKSWCAAGCPEACDDLFDANKELIEAYTREHPTACAYKSWVGIVPVSLKSLYNFCYDVIFDGAPEHIEAVCQEPDEVKRLALAASFNGHYLIWS